MDRAEICACVAAADFKLDGDKTIFKNFLQRAKIT